MNGKKSLRRAIDVLDYWFGELEDGFDKAYRNALWFGNNPDTDQENRERFEDLSTYPKVIRHYIRASA